LVGAGLLDNYSLAGNDIENTPAQFAAQAVCAALQRDFIAEALRVVSIKAAPKLGMTSVLGNGRAS
jgi:hypothetical protein